MFSLYPATELEIIFLGSDVFYLLQNEEDPQAMI